jgi:proline iminopeptidase
MTAAPIEPYDHGMLAVGDGHRLYWETCGSPDGVPVLFLHGGPGSGCTTGQRGLFDPSVFRAVLFDQRGSGRSTPRAEEPEHDLSTNTTAPLIDDTEMLRDHLGIDRWIVTGMSWGTTLGLAYARAHPGRVAGLVLALVTTTSRREVDWITEGMRAFFPAEWDRFVGAIPEHLGDLRPVDAYAEMLADPDPTMRDRAAREWCAWEDTHVSLAPGHRPDRRYDDQDFRLRFATLVTHYWRHGGFLDDGWSLRDVGRLAGIPAELIHGRRDVSSPLITAWDLAGGWPGARLTILEDAGHGGESVAEAFVEALARLV